MRLGSGHCYINEHSEESGIGGVGKGGEIKGGEEKKRERKKKEKVQSVSWVPFLPSHFLCIWSVFVLGGCGERWGEKGGGRPSGAD